MWSWAKDHELVQKFSKFSLREIIFLASFAILYAVFPLWVYLVKDPYSYPAYFLREIYRFMPALNLMAATILFVVRLDIFSLKIHFRKFSVKEIYSIDKKILTIFLGSILAYSIVLISFPEAFPKIFASAEKISKSITPSFEIFSILEQEVMFRLILYYSLNRLFGRNFAFFATLFLFAIWHENNAHLYYPMAVLPGGIALSVVTILTGSLLPGILLHLILNLSVYVFTIYIYPFLI